MNDFWRKGDKGIALWFVVVVRVEVIPNARYHMGAYMFLFDGYANENTTVQKW